LDEKLFLIIEGNDCKKVMKVRELKGKRSTANLRMFESHLKIESEMKEELGSLQSSRTM
jgi:hypothetical protein